MKPPVTRTLILGTRPSKLARWQTGHVAALLQAAWPGLECQILPLTTQGDRILDRALPEIGGKGVFTAELEQALHDGTIDLAVHSLKDLPVDNPPGLDTGAICTRQDVRDVLISAHGWTLEALPPGSRVGTSSLRRSAQLLAARPDLKPASIRGNVDTRLRKALQGGSQPGAGDNDSYAAIVLAAAGLVRLGLEAHITQYLPPEIMLPAPGQGALAVQCREGDRAVQEMLAAIDDPDARAATTAERAFLKGVGGGCSAPIAAYAEISAGEGQPAGGSRIFLRGILASLDGRTVIRVSGRGSDPESLGRQVAHQALDQGAAGLVAREG